MRRKTGVHTIEIGSSPKIILSVTLSIVVTTAILFFTSLYLSRFRPGPMREVALHDTVYIQELRPVAQEPRYWSNRPDILSIDSHTGMMTAYSTGEARICRHLENPSSKYCNNYYVYYLGNGLSMRLIGFPYEPPRE